MTHLCASIFVTELAQAKRDIALSAQAGADMVELRIDRFTDRVQVLRLVCESILPCILTCRPIGEGGHCTLPDDRRLDLLEHAASQGKTQHIDIELASLRLMPKPSAARLIVSSHDFDGRPARLANILLEINQGPASVTKLAWTARTIRDNLEAFEILMNRQKPAIALCMGEAGLISRVLAKKFGAFLTYASLDKNTATAPGQVTVQDLRKLYRWDAINPETKVYGVVGCPIVHSMSPAIHNAAFEQIGYDGVYLPLLVNEGWESFKAFMASFLAFEPLHLSGLSITIPHKENALRYLKEFGADAQIEELAQSIGTVNTIKIDRQPGKIHLAGVNTDYAAILDCITAALAISRDDLRNYRVAVIGAGGTGRTAVAALAHCGATVVVYNRTLQRAQVLAQEFNGCTGKVVPANLEKLCDSSCQIYINTTSVGMFPNVDATPMGQKMPKLSKDTLVFDTIYNPTKTKLLRQAEEIGAKVIGGVEMFLRQAAGQFRLWTGRQAPLPAMRNVIEQRLAT
jgi:3-dehydroquinate dehydratase/shikimate dehydrogenase